MSGLDSLIKDIAKKHGEGTANIMKDYDNIEVKRFSSGLPSLDRIM